MSARMVLSLFKPITHSKNNKKKKKVLSNPDGKEKKFVKGSCTSQWGQKTQNWEV